jgi:hypothetical protein
VQTSWKMPANRYHGTLVSTPIDSLKATKDQLECIRLAFQHASFSRLKRFCQHNVTTIGQLLLLFAQGMISVGAV